MIIIGKGIYIRDLRRKDVDQMKEWGTHRDPLFHTYNFPKGGPEERDHWFNEKQKPLRRKIYGVFLEEGKLIGYITIKKIDFLRKKGELGIVFNPDYLSEGYGTKAMELFLQFYFHRWKRKVLTLQVAAFNHRAIRVYEKLGFQKVKQKMEPFENQKLSWEELVQRGYRKGEFKKEKKTIYCCYLTMRITEQDIHKIHKGNTVSVENSD